jgi:hypothetical protein
MGHTFYKDECRLSNSYLIYERKLLCNSPCGIPIYYLSIAGRYTKNKKYIYLCARVHASEVTSSMVLEGIINLLISGSSIAQDILSKYTFIILPMLNPDGVVMGNYRSTIFGRDLNRQWQTPDENLDHVLSCWKAIISIHCKYASQQKGHALHRPP